MKATEESEQLRDLDLLEGPPESGRPLGESRSVIVGDWAEAARLVTPDFADVTSLETVEPEAWLSRSAVQDSVTRSSMASACSAWIGD
jgi:hypothetical protein